MYCFKSNILISLYMNCISVAAHLDIPLFNMSCYSYGDSGIIVFGGDTVNNSNPIQAARSVRFWSAKDNKWIVNDTRQ
jgi:hypothetical protein